jgi:hypothetical protein
MCITTLPYLCRVCLHFYQLILHWPNLPNSLYWKSPHRQIAWQTLRFTLQLRYATFGFHYFLNPLTIQVSKVNLMAPVLWVSLQCSHHVWNSFEVQSISLSWPNHFCMKVKNVWNFIFMLPYTFWVWCFQVGLTLHLFCFFLIRGIFPKLLRITSCNSWWCYILSAWGANPCGGIMMIVKVKKYKC